MSAYFLTPLWLALHGREGSLVLVVSKLGTSPETQAREGRAPELVATSSFGTQPSVHGAEYICIRDLATAFGEFRTTTGPILFGRIDPYRYRRLRSSALHFSPKPHGAAIRAGSAELPMPHRREPLIRPGTEDGPAATPSPRPPCDRARQSLA